jgi:hypothetical protein
MKTATGSIDALAAHDGKRAHIFILLSGWTFNGTTAQSTAMTVDDVDWLIDELITAQQDAMRSRKRRSDESV